MTTVAKKAVKTTTKPAVKAVKITASTINDVKVQRLSTTTYTKWSKNVAEQKGDQRLHYYTLGIAIKARKISMVDKEGKAFDFKELIDEGNKRIKLDSNPKEKFWQTWAIRENKQWEAFFKTGNPSSYVSGTIYEMKKLGYHFK